MTLILASKSEAEACTPNIIFMAAYTAHLALMCLEELKALRDLSKTATAKIYIGFDKHKIYEAKETI